MSLTPVSPTGYSDRVAPHCANGIAARNHEAHNRAQAVFLCVPFSFLRVAVGWMGSLRAAGSSCRSANPIQFATLGFAAFGGGSQSIHEERTAMHTQAKNSPAIRVRNLDAIDTASARIAQATAFLDVMMLAGTHDGESVSPSTITNYPWGIRLLLEQASAAVGEV